MSGSETRPPPDPECPTFFFFLRDERTELLFDFLWSNQKGSESYHSQWYPRSSVLVG